MSNIGTLIDGRYAGTYNSVDIGFTEDGFTLFQSVSYELINESDLYGGALIDMIYRGGDCKVQCDSKEYKAGSTAPYWPYGALGVMATTAAPIGRRASDVAMALVLTAAANTPAAASPATLTGTYAALAPGFDGRLLFNSKLRRVPLMLQLLPSEASGTVKWFATT